MGNFTTTLINKSSSPWHVSSVIDSIIDPSVSHDEMILNPGDKTELYGVPYQISNYHDSYCHFNLLPNDEKLFVVHSFLNNFGNEIMLDGYVIRKNWFNITIENE